MDDALHRRRAKAGPVTEPARPDQERPFEIRVGSSTNALRPILAAERPLGAGSRQWLGLAAIASRPSPPTS